MTIRPRSTETARLIRPATLPWLSMALLVVLATAPGFARAQDADYDGVADTVDACPQTEPADLVGPDGCASCSCEGGPDGAGWSSRRAYVACVRGWAKDLRTAGTIAAPAGRLLIRRARASTCGSPSLVRCCVFPSFDAEIGKCRVMTEEACDALDERLFDEDGEANNEGAGSCLPNPCTF